MLWENQQKGNMSMDLEQCYKELEGDYAEVMRRLRKEELVHRFLIKFLESDEVQRIDEAL